MNYSLLLPCNLLFSVLSLIAEKFINYMNEYQATFVQGGAIKDLSTGGVWWCHCVYTSAGFGWGKVFIVLLLYEELKNKLPRTMASSSSFKAIALTQGIALWSWSDCRRRFQAGRPQRSPNRHQSRLKSSSSHHPDQVGTNLRCLRESSDSPRIQVARFEFAGNLPYSKSSKFFPPPLPSPPPSWCKEVKILFSTTSHWW